MVFNSLEVYSFVLLACQLSSCIGSQRCRLFLILLECNVGEKSISFTPTSRTWCLLELVKCVFLLPLLSFQMPCAITCHRIPLLLLICGWWFLVFFVLHIHQVSLLQRLGPLIYMPNCLYNLVSHCLLWVLIMTLNQLSADNGLFSVITTESTFAWFWRMDSSTCVCLANFRMIQKISIRREL